MSSFLLAQLILNTIADAFVGAWLGFSFVLINGGWILLSAFLLWAKFYFWWKHKEEEYEHAAEWVFLSVSLPDIAGESIMAAEQFFAQVHATKKTYDWRETWLLGQFPLWYSFEIVSLGGSIKYLIRSLRQNVDAVKAALYAQYPDAEINEAGDYMAALKYPFNPDEIDYDLWGTDLVLDKNECYPIKTYPAFEHKAADTIIDPLAGLLEVATNIEPEEMIAVQILALPADDSWKKHAVHEVEKLKGKPHGGHTDGPPTLMQHLSEKEKDVINAIENKLGKLSYLSKVRFLYAAPKGKLKSSMRVSAIMGAFAQYATYDMNSFKQSKFNKTKLDVHLSEKYESKKVSEFVLWRKRAFLKAFRGREITLGAIPYHLSTEELASLFHLPLESVRSAAIEKTDARKGEAPVNLPI